MEIPSLTDKKWYFSSLVVSFFSELGGNSPEAPSAKDVALSAESNFFVSFSPSFHLEDDAFVGKYVDCLLSPKVIFLSIWSPFFFRTYVFSN